MTARRQRHQSEFRQHRKASADARNAEEDVTEAAVLRGLLQLRPRIGNGHKIPSGGVADGVGDARKKIIHQNIRFERGPGFAGNNESCVRDVDAALEAPHLIRVSGIEHMQVGMAGRRSQALGQHLGAELDPPMPRRRTSLKPLSRSSWPKSRSWAASRSSSPTMSSQPNQAPSSRPVQSEASLLQRRCVFSLKRHACCAKASLSASCGGSAIVCPFIVSPKRASKS